MSRTFSPSRTTMVSPSTTRSTVRSSPAGAVVVVGGAVVEVVGSCRSGAVVVDEGGAAAVTAGGGVAALHPATSVASTTGPASRIQRGCQGLVRVHRRTPSVGSVALPPPSPYDVPGGQNECE